MLEYARAVIVCLVGIDFTNCRGDSEYYVAFECGDLSMTSTSAPAKIILFGEHGVVYGKAAVAVPVSALRAVVVVKSVQDGFCLASRQTGEVLSLDDVEHPLVKAVSLTLVSLASVGVFDLKASFVVDSQIPVGSGLGSGAAVSAALVKAVYSYLGVGYDYANINNLVYSIEKHYHGTPSGIDNTVIVYEKPVYFVKGKPIDKLTVKGSFHFLIGDTGTPSSTKTTVAHVRSLYDAHPKSINSILDTIDDISKQARESLATNAQKRLGNLMTQNHNALRQLEVSTPELDTLVQAALNAGALGAKLSGGGGGGNMIALVSPNASDKVQQALLEAGAVSVYTTDLTEKA